MLDVRKQRTAGYLFKIWLLALLATIGFDLFLHAGVLAPLYADPSPFLLSSEESFGRIPLGYLSFAALTALMVWLIYRLDMRGWKRGLVFGLTFGAITWGSFILGLFSISTAGPLLLVGWFLGQAVELGIAGAILGIGLQAKRLRSLLTVVIVFFVVMVVLAILLQNLGNFG